MNLKKNLIPNYLVGQFTGIVYIYFNHIFQLTSKENKQVLEDKTRLTEHFIATLPQLLLKVSGYRGSLSAIVHISEREI